jgi:predicted  nucleic acid-binding Zn-ribbon protein
VEKDLMEYLHKMELRMHSNLENALNPIHERLERLETKVGETNEIVKALRHGQELSRSKIESIEKSMRYIKAKLTEHDEKIFTLSDSNIEY